MGFEVWKPLDEIGTDKYLYHYTSMEKAYSILYNNELLFSAPSKTNDIFEQKVKIAFKDYDYSNFCDVLNKEERIRNYLNRVRERIRILCFSMDTKFKTEEDKKQYIEMRDSLSSDMKTANVIGRGFALPRMWAQYADNSKGVCFILNKSEVIKIVQKNLINYYFDTVTYSPLYTPYLIAQKELDDIDKLIEKYKESAINKMISDQYQFMKYDLLYKLSDWENEYEYRLITVVDEGSEMASLKKVGKAIEGVVVGANVDKLHTTLLKNLCKKIDVRQINYNDIITTIQTIGGILS